MTTQQQGKMVPVWTVGDRLRKAREITGLDQEPFADLILVSRGTVSNYERDSIDNYRRIVLKAWSDATGVCLDWIINGDANHPGPTGGNSTDELRRLTESKRSRARRRAPTDGYAVAASAAA